MIFIVAYIVNALAKVKKRLHFSSFFDDIEIKSEKTRET